MSFEPINTPQDVFYNVIIDSGKKIELFSKKNRRKSIFDLWYSPKHLNGQKAGS